MKALNSEDGKYLLEIDVTDTKDMGGDTATFLPVYEKCIYLMRWISRAIKENTLIKIG